MTQEDKKTGVSDERKENHDVSVDAVHDDELVPNDWYELGTRQYRRRQDAEEMDHDSELLRIVLIYETFSWNSGVGTVDFGVTEDSVEGEVL